MVLVNLERPVHLNMPPRISTLSLRSIAFRIRPVVPQKRTAQNLQQRFASNGATNAPEAKGPNMDNAPHVSEEQAAMDKTMGETPPDIEGQGTPVLEVSMATPLPRVTTDTIRSLSETEARRKHLKLSKMI